MKSNKKFGKFGAKGYYIALILCAAAIGISGYVFYRNANNSDPQLQEPTGNVNVGNQNHATLPVVGTDPGVNDPVKDPNPTQPNAEPAKQPLKTCPPLEGETVSDYAMDCLAYNETTRDWRVHDGIDIAADAGAKVCAAAAGTVYTTYTDDKLGATVVIHHAEGYVSVYSSLSNEILVEPGDTVTMGQTIGTVGNTALLESAIGDHLHFSVTKDGESVDPNGFLSLE